MKALVYTNYGSPDILQIKEVKKPTPKDDEVLVRMRATTVNRTDCAIIRAKPFFMRIVTGLFKPKKQIPGTAFSGEIAAVGSKVWFLKPGDNVFGFDDTGSSCHAEYLTILEDKVVIKPDNISHAQAAASSEGVHYACNFVNKVNLKEGQHVLVNGATGAIGSAAVQLLRYFDIDVTAVCPTKNIALVKSLGARHVIDYLKEDFTNNNNEYDFVFDTVGKSSFFKCKKILKPGGVYISSDLGFMWQNMFLPLVTPIVKRLIGGKKTVSPIPINIMKSLVLIDSLFGEDKLEVVIDRQYPLENIVDAYRYVEKGQKIGNVVITV